MSNIQEQINRLRELAESQTGEVQQALNWSANQLERHDLEIAQLMATHAPGEISSRHMQRLEAIKEYVTFCHGNRPNIRFRQATDTPLPSWATDVQPEKPGSL